MVVRNEKGFTLIELVIIIAVLGILAAVATVQFGNLVQNSKDASLQGAAGAASAQLALAIGNLRALPTVAAPAGAACVTALAGSATYGDRVHNCLVLTGQIFKGNIETNDTFNICTGAACAGVTGTGCGSTAERFIRVSYSSATGALTFTGPASCAS